MTMVGHVTHQPIASHESGSANRQLKLMELAAAGPKALWIVCTVVVFFYLCIIQDMLLAADEVVIDIYVV